jgi:hypothetical protein
MKMIILILLVGLLGLAACEENGDEPTPAKVDDVDIYLTVNGWEDLDRGVIYSANGDTIYITEEGQHIDRLAADGSDWYAGLVDENHVYHVIKNGQELFSTDETVFSLCADSGNVYTLRAREVDWRVEYEWVYKNQERIYQIDTGEYFSTQILVKDGHITLAPYYSPTPRYWQDGQFVDMQSVEGELEYCCIDKVGDDVLIGFNGMNGLRGYWRNGNYYNDIPDRMSINAVKLVNGKVILAGSVVVSQGVSGVKTAPVIVNDGKEYRTEGTVAKMIVNGKDLYYLCNSSLCQIFKNMKPVPLGYIEVKNERYQEVFGDRINLSQIPNLSDFIVVTKKK